MKVSVIIPTFNRPSKLKRAIDSVLSQTYKDVELLVVDDNAPATSARLETESLMVEYSGDIRIKYIKHNCNRNGAAARNSGIRASTGEYISFLDDDDYYLPEKIQKQVTFLGEHPEYCGVYCARYIEGGGHIQALLSGDLTRQIVCMEYDTTTPALMFRREAVISVGGFTESFRRHQDYEFLLRYFQKYALGALNEPLVVIDSTDTSNRVDGAALERLKAHYLNMFSELILNLEGRGVATRREVFGAHYSQVFVAYLRERNFGDASRIYFHYLNLVPFRFQMVVFKALARYLASSCLRLFWIR